MMGICRPGSKALQRIIEASLLFLMRRSWRLEEVGFPGFIGGIPA